MADGKKKAPLQGFGGWRLLQTLASHARRGDTSFEIPGLIAVVSAETVPTIADLDFFSVPENRKLILEREEWRCFYCLAQLDENNHVIEHVVSRPEGDNSFLNIVAACRRCNNRKSETVAADFLRLLYREGILSGDAFTVRVSLLERLQRGELPPSVPS